MKSDSPTAAAALKIAELQITDPKSPMLRVWIPALLWLAVIAWESTMLSSGLTSSFLLPVLQALIPGATPEQLALLHAGLRKSGHFIGYAVLSLFLYRAWWGTLLLRKSAPSLQAAPGWPAMFRRWNSRAAALALLGTVVVASLDEFQQSLHRGRTGSPSDVLLDTAGAWFIQMIILGISSSRVHHGPVEPGRRAATSKSTAEIADSPAESSSGSSAP